MHKWTKFELDYLRLISWNRSQKDIARMFNDHFKLDISCTAIVGAMKRNNIQTGRTGYFNKGNIPHNKGKKMPPEVYEKAKATMFKKGNIPPNNSRIFRRLKKVNLNYPRSRTPLRPAA